MQEKCLLTLIQKFHSGECKQNHYSCDIHICEEQLRIIFVNFDHFPHRYLTITMATIQVDCVLI